MLKASEGDVSLQLQRFLQFVNSWSTENWKERRPKEELALGVTSEIYLMERVLRVGVVMVTSELR